MIMPAANRELDPHEKPPDFLKDVYKSSQKLAEAGLEEAPELLHFGRSFESSRSHAAVELYKISRATVDAACRHLSASRYTATALSDRDVQVYEARDIPGLQVIPSLIPKDSQVDMLSRLLHRDLADERHRTNVHLHHKLPYHATHSSPRSLIGAECKSPQLSFFNMSPDCSESFVPRNTRIHKPFTVSQFLNRKLRWMTLGGQYDWTQKKYPVLNPLFPTDIAAFTHGLFPGMTAEAAIVNVYTPGDTLSLHRDVSEESDKALVSISLGCDGIFVVGQRSEEDHNPRSIVIRLHSGDAVCMSGSARFAWHGVSRIIPDTCPEWLRSWPAGANAEETADDVNDVYEPWRNWMSHKRINLNIRQMRD